MTRKMLPRLAAAGTAVAAKVGAPTVGAVPGFAPSSSAAQANYAPTNTAAPSISGTPQVGQTLTANPGSWTSDTTPTFAYQWNRCDAQGNNCARCTACRRPT